MLKIALLLSLGSATAPALQITPSPIDPRMPSVDRLASRIRAELGTTASTDLHVCVRPSGKVASVTLVGGSAMPDFDLAMVKDASAWQFTSMPGPDTLQTCRTVTIAYHPHR
jgi:hypothetical protein